MHEKGAHPHISINSILSDWLLGGKNRESLPTKLVGNSNSEVLGIYYKLH